MVIRTLGYSFLSMLLLGVAFAEVAQSSTCSPVDPESIAIKKRIANHPHIERRRFESISEKIHMEYEMIQGQGCRTDYSAPNENSAEDCFIIKRIDFNNLQKLRPYLHENNAKYFKEKAHNYYRAYALLTPGDRKLFLAQLMTESIHFMNQGMEEIALPEKVMVQVLMELDELAQQCGPYKSYFVISRIDNPFLVLREHKPLSPLADDFKQASFDDIYQHIRNCQSELFYDHYTADGSAELSVLGFPIKKYAPYTNFKFDDQISSNEDYQKNDALYRTIYLTIRKAGLLKHFLVVSPPMSMVREHAIASGFKVFIDKKTEEITKAGLAMGNTFQDKSDRCLGPIEPHHDQYAIEYFGSRDAWVKDLNNYIEEEYMQPIKK